MRTNIPVTKAVFDGFVIEPAATALDAANGHVVTPREARQLRLRVNNSAVTTHTVTVDPGSGAGSEPGVAALAVPVAPSQTVHIGPFTSARFDQAGGTSINIDLDAGFTGTVWAFEDPRGD